MKNYEKYADEIKGCDGLNFCRDFVKPYILKSRDCANTSCDQCKMLQIIWLMEEYEEPKEPEVDWSKVEVDTPILVKAIDDGKWNKRYFAKYEGGKVYAWQAGGTSWDKDCVASWKYAKLAEDEKEPEVDWGKIKVDTPILVRQGKNGKWLERHFAKYENGDVYAWVDGQTSWTGADEIKWKYSKLAEDEKECKNPEVDWSKVEVDTTIYVKASKYGNWFKRHFAEYKNGKIYTWGNGLTSHDTSRMMEWNYAKLAESEE